MFADRFPQEGFLQFRSRLVLLIVAFFRTYCFDIRSFSKTTFFLEDHELGFKFSALGKIELGIGA